MAPEHLPSPPSKNMQIYRIFLIHQDTAGNFSKLQNIFPKLVLRFRFQANETKLLSLTDDLGIEWRKEKT